MDGSLPAGYAEALARLDRRIARELAHLRARYELGLDELRGLYVSDAQVDALMRSRPDAAVLDTSSSESLAAGLREVPAWRQLADAFALASCDETIVLIALAPELDVKYETLYAYLNDDVARRWPTADLAARLLRGERHTRIDVLASLAPGSPLRTSRVIDAIDAPATRTGVSTAGFALHPLVARHLQGVAPRQDAALRASTAALSSELGSSPPATTAGPRPAATIRGLRRRATLLAARTSLGAAQCRTFARLATLIRDRARERPVVVLDGAAGAPYADAVAVVAAMLSLHVREIDLGLAATDAATRLADLALEATLSPCVLCVRGLDALADRAVAASLRRGLAALEASGRPLVFVAPEKVPWRDALPELRALTVTLCAPDFAQRGRAWRNAANSAGVTLAADDEATLADRYAFSLPEIARAAANACDRAVLDGAAETLTAAALHEAARAETRDRVVALARRVDDRHGWQDLVLPPSVAAQLHDFTEAVRLRHRVYVEWNFAARLGQGSGIRALFAGASGTGKTMAAGVITHELGLDLYKVDLSCVVSKYLGETEKNLDRVFAAARANHAALFFDEADAIFGKRSEVKDAHDRYANVETAYLLQKVEEHEGVVILATNLKRNVDEAFARRMQYVIDFPAPDVAERERLWRGMFPAGAPLGDDVDFAFLARRFELAGGDIRNVALDAAFFSASAGTAIGMPQLVRAVARQWAKQGRTATRADFEPHYAAVTEATGTAS